jgi:hypothetical protein
MLKALLCRIVETGDVIGHAGPGRSVLAVTVDELAAIEAEEVEREEDLAAV